MDKKTAIKMLAGTIARGLLWVTGALATKIGIESMNESAAEGAAYFIAAIVVWGLSSYWSSRKNKRLADEIPPVVID